MTYFNLSCGYGQLENNVKWLWGLYLIKIKDFVYPYTKELYLLNKMLNLFEKEDDCLIFN